MSLADFDGFDGTAVAMIDDRFEYGEVRFRAFGRIAGKGYSIAFVGTTTGIRLISFRRAHEKEMRRYEHEPAPEDHDDNPEWTEEDFARARPAGEIFPPHVAAALVRRGPGRPAGSNKQQVTLRLDRDVLDRLREGGDGWQTRLNDTLRKAVGL